MQEEVERDEKGRFPAGTSGNKLGRPKGSKNRVTLLKLMVEQAARERNFARAEEVIDSIYEAALQGDSACRKLVWQAHMSGNSADDTTKAGDKPQITINGPTTIEQPALIENPTQEELANDGED